LYHVNVNSHRIRAIYDNPPLPEGMRYKSGLLPNVRLGPKKLQREDIEYVLSGRGSRGRGRLRVGRGGGNGSNGGSSSGWTSTSQVTEYHHRETRSGYEEQSGYAAAATYRTSSGYEAYGYAAASSAYR
jgi:hypothetical protein